MLLCSSIVCSSSPMVQRTFFTAYCITPNLFCQGVCKKKTQTHSRICQNGQRALYFSAQNTFKHRDSRTEKDFRAGVLRQRHGCSPDCGDRHSFHFSPRRLRELKKELHFFIKGIDKSKKSCHTATIITRLLLEDDSRVFFQKSIRKSFNSRILFVGDFFTDPCAKSGGRLMLCVVPKRSSVLQSSLR